MSRTLAERLGQRIAAQGPLSFHDFMEAALYDPQDGYYGAGKAVIGRGGDFYTSVSAGPLFGRLLARQFAAMWTLLGRPERFDVVEQGAHDGQLARDVLDALRAQAPDCFEHLRFTIIEPAAALRDRQVQALQAYRGKVRWVDEVAACSGIEGVHFSNELIDAFPVHRVRWTGSEWTEDYVDFHDGQFRFVDHAPESRELQETLRALPRNLPKGYVTEVNLAALAWIRAVATRLQRGWLLVIDYGYHEVEYLRPDREGGTLTGYRKHQRIGDPLAAPGSQDLTAHVNFTALARAGLASGMALAGFTDQHHFVVGLSRLHFRDTDDVTPEAQRELLAFRTLMHPGLLGRSFKVLAMCKDVETPKPLAGFAFAEESYAALGIARETAI